MRQIAFVGLGRMGSPMCAALVSAGYQVAATDKRAEAEEEAIACGAIWRGTPAQAAAGAGVLITTVSPNTPAAQAGVQTGDVLVAIDNVAIDNGQTLGGLIQNKQGGQSITLTIKRGGQTLMLHATLVERPTSA